VEEDGQGEARVVGPGGSAVGLERPGVPHHDRVDRLQVAGVGQQSHGDLPGRGGPRPARPEVVPDVVGGTSRDPPALDVRARFELVEDGLVWDAEDVDQDVEPAPVGHPQHHRPGTRRRSGLESLVQHRH
jgi:hypothetical protein